MTTVVFSSIRGAPGVTTTALLVTGCLPDAVLVEADLDGGVLATTYRLEREPGLTTLAASRTTASNGVQSHAQTACGIPVVVGPDDPTVAYALWSHAGTDLAAAFASAGACVLVDAGRLRSDAPVLSALAGSDLLVVTVRPEADHLVPLARRLPEIRTYIADVTVVLAGSGHYRPTDVVNQLGVDVLAVIPTDGRTTAAMKNGTVLPAAVPRRPLARAARSLAEAITERVEQSTPAGNEVSA